MLLHGSLIAISKALVNFAAPAFFAKALIFSIQFIHCL
jgi:hypothetical protein